MNYRYITLGADPELYSGLCDDFVRKFNDNTWFIGNYLSLQIRTMKISTCGSYNKFSCRISKKENSIREVSVDCLQVKLQVEEDEIINYLNMKEERARFDYYLSLLERAYRFAASTGRNIPIDVFLKLHQDFREGGYKNERLFKKKQLRDYGIKIELHHVLTSYSYNLMLSVYNLKNNLISKGSIYETFPDDILFNKTVRHLEVEDGKMIISDFLNHPQFICNLEDVAKGIIQSVCVDEDTQKYIPNETNKAKFESLKW